MLLFKLTSYYLLVHDCVCVCERERIILLMGVMGHRMLECLTGDSYMLV